MDVRKQVLLVFSQITTIQGGRVGIGELDNKANSVQLQLPTGTELGNNLCVHKNKSQIFSFQKLLFLYEKEQITS